MRWLMLSESENKVLELVLQGKGKIEISQALHLSPRTIEKYIGNILACTDCRNCHQLTANILNQRIAELEQLNHANNQESNI